MVSVLAYPKRLLDAREETALTVVLPAPDGCDLACSFCLIQQRRELGQSGAVLAPGDYASFVRGLARDPGIGCVAIQGEEPLLKSTLPYTFRVLETAQEVRAPAAMVTNGTHLAEVVDRLAEFDLAELTVSVDSDKPEIHDKLRGRHGTFERVVCGLRAAQSRRNTAAALSVASVLLPSKAANLLGMPALLSSLGVRQWFVAPAIRVGKNSPGGPVEEWSSLVGSLQMLAEESDTHGISMIVEDEYDCLRQARSSLQPLKPLRFRNLDHPGKVLRLLPSGACDIGHAILQRHASRAVWRPADQCPTDFFKGLTETR